MLTSSSCWENLTGQKEAEEEKRSLQSLVREEDSSRRRLLGSSQQNAKMENGSDFEGGSVVYGELTASTDLKEELIASLTSFSRVYSERRDDLQRASERFALTTATLQGVQEDDSEKAKISRLLSVIGGFGGAACGGSAGDVGRMLGGVVGAATCIRGNTLGFVSSVLVGVAGGAVGGAVRGLVCASPKATGGRIHGVVSKVSWLTLGCATGSAVGGIFGGMLGATGGAVGGAYGAYCAVNSVGLIADHLCLEMKEKSVDFCENIEPLVDELKTIKTISDKMASSAVVRGVARQTAKTLTSVALMVKLHTGSRSASDLPQFASSVEAAAKQSKKVTEEMEEMSAEVEKLLVSLRQ